MKKYLFVDRDGTLIREPADEQIDSLEKLELIPGVIPALLSLQKSGYRLVMVSNQDGLGSPSFPTRDFEIAHNKMLQIFNSQGVHFEETLICPHRPADLCLCRKPHLGLVRPYLTSDLDLNRSAVIGDRESDLLLAKNMGLAGYRIGENKTTESWDWESLAAELIAAPRRARIERSTKETRIKVEVTLEGSGKSRIHSGIEFFDHMLEQISRHGGFDLDLDCQGDLKVDEHHTVEDCALALGEALKRALGDKVGISRYGWVLPMDEAQAQASIDLSGRPHFVFEGTLHRERVGGLPTELVPHFFKSLSDALAATLHIQVKGENAHHMVEASFKAVGRALRMAFAASREGGLPSTKGIL